MRDRSSSCDAASRTNRGVGRPNRTRRVAQELDDPRFQAGETGRVACSCEVLPSQSCYSLSPTSVGVRAVARASAQCLEHRHGEKCALADPTRLPHRGQAAREEEKEHRGDEEITPAVPEPPHQPRRGKLSVGRIPPAYRLVTPIVALTVVLTIAARTMRLRTSRTRSTDRLKPTSDRSHAPTRASSVFPV
jgi:hypothetical protein